MKDAFGATSTGGASVSWDAERSIVTISGELHHEGVVEVEGTVYEAIAAAQDGLGLDLAAVTFVDSAGMRLILQTQMSLADRQQKMTLLRPSDNVVRLLQLTGLDDLVSVSGE